MDISHFIKYFKKQVRPQIIDIFRQFETVVEASVTDFDIPIGESQRHKFIHGKIFENSISQAAKNSLPDKKLLDEFKSLYSDFCSHGANLDHYMVGMKNAGSVAWSIIQYMRLQQGSYNLGQKIKNTGYPALRPNLLIDFIQPTLIYDFKFSTLSTREEYESKYLVNGLIQVLIYYLCTGITPENVKLGVLVFYIKLNKVVFYSSNLHYDGFCVRLLKEHMEMHNPDSDTDTMPELELSIRDTSVDEESMPHLESLS